MVVFRDQAWSYSDYYVLVNRDDRGTVLGIGAVSLDVKSAREMGSSTVVELDAFVNDSGWAMYFHNKVREIPLDLVECGFVRDEYMCMKIQELNRWTVKDLLLNKVIRHTNNESQICVTVELERGVFPGASPEHAATFDWSKEGF
jgi:hypothetical protein